MSKQEWFELENGEIIDMNEIYLIEKNRYGGWLVHLKHGTMGKTVFTNDYIGLTNALLER